MGERLIALALRTRSGATAGTVVTLAVALLATVFGVGALGRTTDVSDGSAWLWSGGQGQVSRVNAQTGRVDLRQPVADARGHRLRVTQNDGHLILHDLDTGRVTSVDLKSLGFSGRLDLGARGDYRLVLAEHAAFLVDRTTGEVRVVNPATLQPTGAALRLPGPLIGGEFDGAGTLWVASPGQGTAIGVRLAEGRPTIAHTVPVAAPGRDLTVTVLDRGLLAVDRGGRDLVAVVDGKPRRIASPVPLTGARVPDRTTGALAAVTVPDARAVVTVANVAKDGSATSTRLSTPPGAGAAVPFSGRLYVPDPDGRRVRVYQPGGAQVGVVTINAGGGGLDLQVHENSLFINDPGGRTAAVVSPGGEVKVVDKTEGPSTIGGDRERRSPVPEPSDTKKRPDDPTTPPTRKPAPPGTPSPRPPVSPKPTNGPSPDPSPTITTTPAPPPEPRTGDAPGAPVPVTALAGDGQVKLSWSKAHSPDAPVQSYLVTFDFGGRVTVPGGKLNTVLTGLVNDHTYRFKVTATNKFGTGPFAVSDLCTPSDTYPDAPADISAEEVNGELVVRWAEVSGVHHYVVTTHGGDYPVRQVGNDDPIYIGGKPKIELRIPRSALSPGSYSFTVVAVSVHGGSSTGVRSNTIQVGGS